MVNLQNRLQVKILSPEETLYEGQAIAVSGHNNKGIFDILPRHIDFISIISKNLTVFINENSKQQFENIHGVIRCFNNEVTIYIGI